MTEAETKSVAEIAHWAREIHEEIVAIGTEDHERLNRIEAELGKVHAKINAICRAIGGPLKGLGDDA